MSELLDGELLMDLNLFGILAALVLLLHLLWIAGVILGCLLTRRRRVLALLHIGSLVYSIVIEVGPWPCPLTVAEQWLQRRAGGTSYRGGFLVYYLEVVIYPNVSQELLTWCAASVCLFNLGIYGRRFWRMRPSDGGH